MTKFAQYVHLVEGIEPPEDAVAAPYRAVVIAEEAVSPEWRAKVSAWLVATGCLYVSAWGTECSEWDNSVDMANIEANHFEDIPRNKFVMTTWHENETLAEAFWFAKNNAHHPSMAIQNTLLIHVARVANRGSLLASYAEA